MHTKLTVCLSAQAAMMGSGGGGGSLGGVTSTGIASPFAGGPGPAPALTPSASPAKVPAVAAPAPVDLFGGDLFGAQPSQPSAPLPMGSGSSSPSPARPPPPSGDSPLPSQTNTPARRASKSAFDDLNESIRAALGTSPAKQAPMQAAPAPALGQYPPPPMVGSVPGVPGVPVAPGAAPGLVGFGSPARQPAVAGE